ncbi:MAG: YabP/YqfC family sporulation protein [Lachnospiraceae bacterium]|nr:YabP/YqfC family sporulation protein [Lachnospiraceae bacterium]
MLLLSGDVLYGDVLIRTIGNREVEVENFRGIINYDDKKLILQGKRQLIIISGECLVILSYMDNMIRLQGTICDIEFRM